MELRDFAQTVLLGSDLQAKLAAPAEPLTDEHPGPPLRPLAPGRPADLQIVPAPKAPVPSLQGMADPNQRRRILHALANHELQAAELYAWALLAFPDAGAEFRRDLLAVLLDEQRHTRMYAARLEANGARLGDFPVSGYFWHKAPYLSTPLRFVCAMALTFENANLDHTVDYAEAARRAGDTKTAAVIDRVHQDEVEHVRLGWKWLQAWKGGASAWEVFNAQLTWPLHPSRARGRRFHPHGREAAGLDPEFIRLLEESGP
ncbi:MAG TPA: DUF455 family protein [Thermoanaerobaculia bacterium]|nr:DUF455 family protein [Thermoanaerobaculia bacterium]